MKDSPKHMVLTKLYSVCKSKSQGKEAHRCAQNAVITERVFLLRNLRQTTFKNYVT
jgi:hypothetical protein